ncbi:MAG TPA: CDP-glycerol glycerophosphotransferase family protein [Candidatus Moranbacteria bacterium]|nr:CDP-glycerol glycerophosphotransferase family protein [Candidatus Moranbacteria bacterium]
MNKGKERIVLFGSSNGKYYSDNSMFVFEWILKNRNDIKPVWLTRNRAVFDKLRKEKKPVALINSIKGVVLLFKASVGLFTNSLRDLAINPFLMPKFLNLIALRHGKSVKKVRFAIEGSKILKKEKGEREKENYHIKYAISTSEFISDIQEQCLLIGREKHIVTGYPRNDELFNPSEENKNKWKKFTESVRFNKAILYGPSWRHGREATRFFPFNDFDKNELKNFLESKKIILLLRPHKNDLLRYNSLSKFLKELASSSENIKFVSHDIFPDVNSILPFIDVLISDYSALYHDFLLLDRPLMFVPYDFDDYNKQNGFLYDYYENLPGPALKNFKDFCNNIEAISRGIDEYIDKRRKLCDRVHFYKDSKSCERVSKLIDRILDENK